MPNVRDGRKTKATRAKTAKQQRRLLSTARAVPKQESNATNRTHQPPPLSASPTVQCPQAKSLQLTPAPLFVPSRRHTKNGTQTSLLKLSPTALPFLSPLYVTSDGFSSFHSASVPHSHSVSVHRSNSVDISPSHGISVTHSNSVSMPRSNSVNIFPSQGISVFVLAVTASLPLIASDCMTDRVYWRS